MNEQQWLDYWIEENMKKADVHGPLGKYTADIVLATQLSDLISRLPEEKELPVIPQFVADWIEECKKHGKSLSECLVTFNFNHEKAFNWTNAIRLDREEIIARAWLDDYTIEKEPMYLVKVNDQGSWLYLKSMQLYKDVESRTDLNSNFEAWKEKAIKFTNKEQAEGIAKFFNGEVVEVTDNV